MARIARARSMWIKPPALKAKNPMAQKISKVTAIIEIIDPMMIYFDRVNLNIYDYKK